MFTFHDGFLWFSFMLTVLMVRCGYGDFRLRAACCQETRRGSSIHICCFPHNCTIKMAFILYERIQISCLALRMTYTYMQISTCTQNNGLHSQKPKVSMTVTAWNPIKFVLSCFHAIRFVLSYFHAIKWLHLHIFPWQYSWQRMCTFANTCSHAQWQHSFIQGGTAERCGKILVGDTLIAIDGNEIASLHIDLIKAMLVSVSHKCIFDHENMTPCCRLHYHYVCFLKYVSVLHLSCIFFAYWNVRPEATRVKGLAVVVRALL